jgi:hypothetical protein
LFSDLFCRQQAFKRNGVTDKNLVFGGAGSIGYRPFRNIILEFSIEGGQFASGTASGSGYTYLILGLRCVVRF